MKKHTLNQLLHNIFKLKDVTEVQQIVFLHNITDIITGHSTTACQYIFDIILL